MKKEKETTLHDHLHKYEQHLLSELSKVKKARAAISRRWIGDVKKRHDFKSTVKNMILKVLADSKDRMTSYEIQNEIENKYGRHVTRTSLSPELSRLKANGLVDMTPDRKWSLV